LVIYIYFNGHDINDLKTFYFITSHHFVK